MKKSILFGFIVVLLTSCYAGLEKLPSYSDADITAITFETRWEDPDTHVFKVQNLTNRDLVIDSENQSITVTLIVPPSSTNFPESIRNEVVLNRLILISSISTAATVAPVGNTPKMGHWGDFSQSDLKYQVTAADGTRKVWTLVINGFEK